MALSDSAKTVATGTQTDSQFAAQLIGKDIPVFVGGQALMGCRIIEGPFLYTTDGAGFCDMVVSPALAATPSAGRTVLYLNLNGTTSWKASDGFLGSAFSGMEVNFLYGTEDQTPLASSISKFGDHAVPYRSHICIELKKIPLSVFANTIPFVSAYVYETDYLTRNDGLLKLAQYARFNSDECEFTVSGHDPFWIVAQQTTYIDYLKDLKKVPGRNWNITLSDKLRVFENTATTTPIRLTRDDIVIGTIQFSQVDPLSLPAIRTFGFVATDLDNDFGTAKAVRDRFPVALTSSESSESVELPIGMDTIDAKAAVAKSLLIDDIARDRVEFKAMPWMRGLRSGDIISPDVGNVNFSAGRVLTVARNSVDKSVDITAERIEMSMLAVAPDITSNGGGPTATITIDENTTSVTTVTADDADVSSPFSISGGADAAFFTINSSTGVLTFASAPDFETPLDADGNNVYQVIVKVTGNGLFDTQVISVAVTNVDESTGIDDDTFLLLIV